MATQWYRRAGELESGPVSFLELTAMIRERALNEDDLVRPHYSKEWQTTDSVVGLYYMAQRTPVPRAESSSAELEGGEDGSAGQVTGRAYRLDEVAHDLTGTGQESDTFSEFADILSAAPSLDGDNLAQAGLDDGRAKSSNWGSVLQAAVDHVDARTAVSEEFGCKERGWLGRLIAIYCVVGHSSLMQQVFRLGVAAACVWCFGLWVTDWNSQEMLRFPSRNPQDQELRFFPIIGACNVEDFWLLLCMSAILLGTGAYLVVAKMERRFADLN